MTALDFFYDEFVAFCNKYDLVEQFNKGLQIKGFPYELSCKPFILSRLSPEIFNCSLHWAETPTPKSHSWREIHDLWVEKSAKIENSFKKKSKVFESFPVYYFKYKGYDYLDYVSDHIRQLYYADQLIPVRVIDVEQVDVKNGCPEGVHIISNMSMWALKMVTKYKGVVEYKEYDLGKNIIRMSDKFASIMKAFPAGLSAILELNPSKKVNYLDIDYNTGKVSYLPIEKTLKKDFESVRAYADSNRKTTTIGRLLNKFNWAPYIDRCDIERISNFVSGYGETLSVEIWEPEKIRIAYLEDNYAEELRCIKSTLHNSCMRRAECQDFFEFYEKADVKIAVALDEKGKVCARAILWQINDSLYFLDRIYSISPFYYVKFAKAVASKVPIDFYKVDKTIYNIKTLTEVKMPAYKLFRPKLINYEGLVPYVDTFYIFDSSCGELLTDAKIFRLQSTKGNLIPI